jgi:hypothetical protein
MSRVVSSSRFNPLSKDPESEYKVKRGESKQQLAFGSKKMRNQANCTQYFVKNDSSKQKAQAEPSKSVIIDKERTRTLKKSVTRGALIPSESEFYEKVNKQLAGKLSHTRERSPLRELSRGNDNQDFVRTVRIVDDEFSRKSLGTLAEEVSYVPKLLSRDDSSHKKLFNSSFKNDDIPITRPFSRFDSQEIRSREPFQGPKTEWNKNNTQTNLKSTGEDLRRTDAGGTHSASAFDLRHQTGKRSLLRQSPSDLASNSSAGLTKKWEFVEEMEYKIDQALERSRSRGKLMDFTNGMGNFVSPSSTTDDPLKKAQANKDYTNRINSLNKISDLNYLKYAPAHKRDFSDTTKENLKSSIEIRDVGINRPSHTSLYPTDKGQFHLPNTNSDNKFFQQRSSLYKQGLDGGFSEAELLSSINKEDSPHKRKASTNNIEKILNEIRPDYLNDYDRRSADGSKQMSPVKEDQLGMDIGNFSSFKEANIAHVGSSNHQYQPQSQSKSASMSPLGYSGTEKARSWKGPNEPGLAFDHLSSFSGVNGRGDVFAIEDMSTPSLVPGARASLDWSKSPGMKADTASKSAFGEPSSSRNAQVELNSNFCKRSWSLRFTSSQELKVLVAESIIFIGDKKNGLKCGKGKFITERSGVVLYEGQFYDNLYHGFGKLVNPKVCEVITPNWYLNLDEVEAWVRYEGYFAGGFPEGMGTLFLRNGDSIKGKFVRGRLTGPAAIYSSSGALKFSAEWADNLLLKINS